MNLDHLMWSEDGWGYLPPTEEVFNILREVIEVSNPKSLLEIGFYAGHSTTYWAELLDPSVEIFSCFPDNHPVGEKYSSIVSDKYPNVEVRQKKSPDILVNLEHRNYDLVFIDGNHTFDNCYADTMMALLAGAKWILYDNSELFQVGDVIERFIYAKFLREYDQYPYWSKWKSNSRNYLTLTKVCDNMRQ